jgi:hypothetical protein
MGKKLLAASGALDLPTFFFSAELRLSQLHYLIRCRFHSVPQICEVICGWLANLFAIVGVVVVADSQLFEVIRSEANFGFPFRAPRVPYHGFLI